MDNDLRSSYTLKNRAAAFSLAELVVSIGILVLMFSLAGQVFNMTIKSTGQANAVTEVSQALRAVEDTFRKDLRDVVAGRSLILIQGNPVNAYWTAEGKDSDENGEPSDGYPHKSDPARETGAADPSGGFILEKPRADMLMIFTARESDSYVHPGVAATVQQVVYGHAETVNYEWDAGKNDFVAKPLQAAFPVDAANDDYPDPEAPSPVPASEWLLARRNVLLIPATPPGATDPRWGNWCGPNNICGNADDENLNHPRLLFEGDENSGDVSDVVGKFNYESFVVQPDVRRDSPLNQQRWQVPPVFAVERTASNVEIDAAKLFPARSKIDPKPPAQLANLLGQYLLPYCASFKVEWALDPRSEFVAGRLDNVRETLWFDPGHATDPLVELTAAWDRATGVTRLALADLRNARTLHPDGLLRYSLADRFIGAKLLADPDAWDALSPPADGRPNLIVFGANRRHPGADNVFGTQDDRIVPEDIFPAALRITLDVYDREHRLDRPIRHVMVIPVGG